MSIKFSYENDAGVKNGQSEISDPHFSVLDVAEEAGLKLPYGCRAGSCGSCRVIVKAGLELLAERTPTEQDTLRRCKDDASVRLACRAQFKAGASGALDLKRAPPVEDPEL